MTKTNSSTTQKTKTEQIQEYLERDLPRSVLIAAYRTGRHEAIVRYVKEHYGQSTIRYEATADFIGIEVVVRDAINRIGIKTSPYKELAALPTVGELTERYGEAAAFAINDERNLWLKMVEKREGLCNPNPAILAKRPEETAFTPGPWIAGEPHVTEQGTTAIYSESRLDVAYVYTHASPTIEDKANVRLVTASPAMYELLKATQAYIETHENETMPDEMAALWNRIAAVVVPIEGSNA